MRELIISIARQLAGINYDDMSRAEQNIADLLIRDNYITKDESGQLKANK